MAQKQANQPKVENLQAQPEQQQQVGAGYDISASASASSGSGTGSTKFGDVKVVSNAAGSSVWLIVAAVILPCGLIALGLWYWWKKRRKS
jgi:LPXTG-motif cell wall-anchored protein